MTSRRHPSFEMTMVIHRLYSVASMLIAFTVERNAPQMLYPSHAAGNKLSHALFVLCEARPEDPRFPVTDGAITPGKVGSEIGGQFRSRVSSAASRTALRTARYGRGGISELACLTNSKYTICLVRVYFSQPLPFNVGDHVYNHGISHGGPCALNSPRRSREFQEACARDLHLQRVYMVKATWPYLALRKCHLDIRASAQLSKSGGTGGRGATSPLSSKFYQLAKGTNRPPSLSNVSQNAPRATRHMLYNPSISALPTIRVWEYIMHS